MEFSQRIFNLYTRRDHESSIDFPQLWNMPVSTGIDAGSQLKRSAGDIQPCTKSVV